MVSSAKSLNERRIVAKVDHQQPGRLTKESSIDRVDGGDVMIALFIKIFGFLLTFSAGYAIQALAPAAEVLVAFTIPALISAVAVAACLLAPTPSTLSSLGLGHISSISGRWVILGLLGGLLVPVISTMLFFLYLALAGQEPPSRDFLDAGVRVTSGELATAVLLLVVMGLLGPVIEELLFRGVIYTYFRRFGLVTALVVSSVPFALAHLGGFLLFYAVVGVVFAMLYERSGSLWPGIIAHATNNTLVTLTFVIPGLLL